MSVELDEAVTEEMFPRVLPPGWRRIGDSNKFHTNDGMSVIASAERIDGKTWWHVSCARPGRLPSWEDLRKVKDVFVGRKRSAVQVLPADDEYVNSHAFCLHLWSCLDGNPLPDFRRMGTI